MKAPPPKTILIVEDDAGLQVTLVAALAESGFEARACGDAAESLALAAAFKPTLVFCDVHLNQGDGRAVLAKLRADGAVRDCQFVLMTGDWVGASQRASIDSGADGYLAKPFTIVEFIACVRRHYRQASL